MKYILTITVTAFLFACSSSNSDQQKLEKVISDYCEATNTKNAKAIPGLLYPALFDELSRENVEQMFYNQLKATRKFSIRDLKFEGDAIELDRTENSVVYGQKYSSTIDIGIDSTLASQGFDMLIEMAKTADPNAVIDDDNYEITYSEKKKLMLVLQNDTAYILPDVFLPSLKNPKINIETILEKYKAIP